MERRMVTTTDELTELKRKTLDRVKQWPSALELLKKSRSSGCIATEHHPRGLTRREQSQCGCDSLKEVGGALRWSTPACLLAFARREVLDSGDVGSRVSESLDLSPQYKRV